jgi:hypothetical protein
MSTNKNTTLNNNILDNTNKTHGFYAGAFSGLCQMVVGHPLDTMKVRIQNNKSLLGLGFRDYYKGIGFPTISGMIVNSIVFGSHKYFKEYTGENIASGFMAGATISPFVRPKNKMY